LSLLILATKWVVPEKIHTPHTEEISAVRRGRGEKMFLIIVSVLGHPKEVGGLLLISSVGVVWMFSGMTQYKTVAQTFPMRDVGLGGFSGGVFGFIFKPFFLF
jgi:hypothetical protein